MFLAFFKNSPTMHNNNYAHIILSMPANFIEKTALSEFIQGCAYK